MTTWATDVGTGYAQLNGVINPHGQPVSDCYFNVFDLGPPTQLVASAECQQPQPVSGNGNVNVWATLTTPFTGGEFAYELIAVGAGGQTTGSPVEFTDPPAAAPVSVSQNNKNVLVIIGRALIAAGSGAVCGLTAAGDIDTVGLLTYLTYAACGEAAAAGGYLGAAIADPPDPHYQKVVAPRGFPVPRVRCRRLAPARCRALVSAARRYLRATARALSYAEAAGITADRYGRAVGAHNPAAIARQAAAERRYLPAAMAALARARAAGRALGARLQSDRLNPTISAQQVAQARARLIALRGIPGMGDCPAEVRRGDRLARRPGCGHPALPGGRSTAPGYHAGGRPGGVVAMALVLAITRPGAAGVGPMGTLYL